MNLTERVLTPENLKKAFREVLLEIALGVVVKNIPADQIATEINLAKDVFVKQQSRLGNMHQFISKEIADAAVEKIIKDLSLAGIIT